MRDGFKFDQKPPVKGKKKPAPKKKAAMPPAMAAIGNQMMKGC